MTCFALEFLHLCSLQLILLWTLQIWFDELVSKEGTLYLVELFSLGETLSLRHLLLLRCTIIQLGNKILTFYNFQISVIYIYSWTSSSYIFYECTI